MSVLAQPYKCDVPGCDRVRDNDSNHWWLLWVKRGHDEYNRPETGVFQIHLSPWVERLANTPLVHHYCGAEHALAAMACEVQKITDELNRKSKENTDAA